MKDLLQQSSLITYSANAFCHTSEELQESIALYQQNDQRHWLNTYGLDFQPAFTDLITEHDFDDFLLELLQEQEHGNKVIELDEMLFISLSVVNIDSAELEQKQMNFVLAQDFLWSLQENTGNYFGWVRERLENNKGLVRKKEIDYLLFLLISAIIDNYESILETLTKHNDTLFATPAITPDPDFTEHVEQQKRLFLNFKRAAISLRNTLVKLSSVDSFTLEDKYFTELKEQATNLINEADFELLEIDSKINLLFSIQNHKLNEIMRVLTVISVIFMPLTFITGLYGMNFSFMPELKWKYGYFGLLGIMVVLSVGSIIYFRKKKWL